jgi:transitional endoplasmic reticulum ATPase
MEAVKQELSESFGLILAFSGEAETYKLSFNGVLLHGPPGVGKTFLARATAGEFGLGFMHVAAGDLTSKWVGESTQNIREAFRSAASQVPCLLFFDEFDSIAQRRDDSPSQEDRRTVNQLLQSLEEYRVIRELIVIAATNNVDSLDPAVIRPGRFDRHIRVDLPDLDARMAIFAAQLKGRPIDDAIDCRVLAEKSEGLTPAAIAQVVDAAALATFREATAAGHTVLLNQSRLLGALQQRGGKDRPTVETWCWDRLILPAQTKAELRQVQSLIVDPDAAAAYGVKPPAGILLAGPPGTGKTTIARVMAAESNCSFYPLTVGDLTSKWVGESEQLISRLFSRARQNAPSIVFIDEIDGIAGRRGEWGSMGQWADRQLNQLLAEMDGMSSRKGVFVLAATNRPDTIDTALTRGGRLSRTIWLPLPDLSARIALLEMYSASMPLEEVDLRDVAAITDGMSGADLEALCQEAAIMAMVRGVEQKQTSESAVPKVTARDFQTATTNMEGSKQASSPEGQPQGLEQREALTEGGYL